MRFRPYTSLAAILLSAVAMLWSSTSAADSPDLAETCPTKGLSVYFASGDVPVSDEARALIGKLRETAATCHPYRIDLTARFDSQADGAEAELRARSRLTLLVNVLVDAGIPESRIFVSASPGIADPARNDAGQRGRLHIIEVVFNGSNETEDGFRQSPRGRLGTATAI